MYALKSAYLKLITPFFYNHFLINSLIETVFIIKQILVTFIMTLLHKITDIIVLNEKMFSYNIQKIELTSKIKLKKKFMYILM
jgi:type IV secretory pathway VirB3-like protein